MPRTIGDLVGEARVLVQDTGTPSLTSAPTFRYTDPQMIQAFNGAMVETRAKRPDLFLATPYGLRASLPVYAVADFAVVFPLADVVFDAFVYYLAGRAEMREDTFADDSRAVALMNKFVSQLTAVAS